jgi:ABC-type glycerol-3-phosphate transport system substrate-binding protein
MPADIITRKREYLSGTQTPDILTWISTGEDFTLQEEGLFLDLSELWQDESWHSGFPAAAAGASGTDGSYYMVPFSVESWKIYYRKSLFLDHDFDVPHTWNELLSICAALSDAGITPIALGARFKWPASLWFEYINMRINGSSFHADLFRGAVPFDKEKVRAALETFAHLVEEGMFPADAASHTWASALRLFTDNQAGIYLFNDSLLKTLPPEVQDDIASFPFPPFTPARHPPDLLGTVQGWVVPAACQNPAGALEFLQYCGTEEGRRQLSLIPEAAGFPVLDPSLPEEAETVLPELNRLALPVLKEAVLESVLLLLSDPSPAAIDTALKNMEQVWQSR